MNEKSTPKSKDLTARLFSRPGFPIVWVVFLGAVVTRFWWIRDMFLVWWVYGRDAYFRDGIRVLPGKPTRFSTGTLAPDWPDVVTGFSFFLVVVFGLTMLLLLGLRLYERYYRSRKAA
jgi:hypothetical protein